MRRSLVIFIAIALLSPCALAASKQHKRMIAHKYNPIVSVPKNIEDEFNFWRDIYAKYDHDQAVLHDPFDLSIIYEVIDLPHCEEPPSLACIKRREIAIKEKKAKMFNMIMESSNGADIYSKFKWRYYQQLTTEKSRCGITEEMIRDKFIRAQVGQSDRFADGVRISGRYMPTIEGIFKDRGLPTELTRMIFVESMFNIKARSSVGASGIWQIMPATARHYGLKVNSTIDERNDPITATHGAAKLLEYNHSSVGNWPMAINAYNSGLGLLKKGAAQVGSNDISQIIKDFRHPTYSFASRNFYPEFLAAYHVYEAHEHYFPSVKLDPPADKATLVAEGARLAKEYTCKHNCNTPVKKKVKRASKKTTKKGQKKSTKNSCN